MKFIHEINEAIKEVCAERYKLTADQLDVNGFSFNPNFDLEHGDFHSQAAFSIGKSLRLKPFDVAEEISEILNQRFAAKEVVFGALQGFTNVRISDSVLVSDYLASNEIKYAEPLKTEYEICIVAPSREINHWSYIRLACLALWQAVLLEQKSLTVNLSVYSYENKAFKIKKFNAVRERSEEIIDYLLSISDSYSPNANNQDFAERLVSDFTNIDPLKKSFLWLSSQSFGKKTFSRIFTPQNAAALFFAYPEKDWLLPLDESSKPSGYSARSRQYKENLLYYMACPAIASDIDLNVPELCESANIKYFAETILQRIESLDKQYGISDVAKRDQPENSAPVSTLTRTEHKLIMNVISMEYFRGQAAFEGKVLNFFTLMSFFLADGNKLLNSPDTRLRMSSNNLTRLETVLIGHIRKNIIDFITFSS